MTSELNSQHKDNCTDVLNKPIVSSLGTLKVLDTQTI